MRTFQAPVEQETALRCSNCGALLAKLGAATLTIRRGELEARIDGSFRATLICYRAHCRALNILTLPNAQGAAEATAP